MMIDLDHFKQINDSHGHLIGDAVLREVSRRLRATIRPYDFIGRYGGEEFLILVPSCNQQDLLAGAERLRICAAGTPIKTPDGPISCTISVGVVAAVPQNKDPLEYEQLLRASDAALYRAKANGRNRVELGSLALAASAV
jgi:diguanylate cyclase (GGDEF)-like protein